MLTVLENRIVFFKIWYIPLTDFFSIVKLIHIRKLFPKREKLNISNSTTDEKDRYHE